MKGKTMSEQELKDELDILIYEAEKAGFKEVAGMLCVIRATTEDHSEKHLASVMENYARNKLRAIESRRN